MIRRLRLGSFKCFSEVDVELSRLTLLSGPNASGKSSVFQALILLAQTIRNREWARGLMLNGPELTLGAVSDVLNQADPKKEMELAVGTDTEEVTWYFDATDRRSLGMNLRGLKLGDTPRRPPGDKLRHLLPENEETGRTVTGKLNRLSWLSAERAGPREVLPLLDQSDHWCVGRHGELASGLLYWRGEVSDVRPDLCLESAPPTLFNQVRARMQEFFPRCDLRVNLVEGASSVTLRFRTNVKSSFHRPQNVGFGLTQLFPLIVAVLAAEDGDTILVENPEVHLHPKAQQNVGEFLAEASQTGVQIMVESHSDHVLNGIRLAVQRSTCSADDVAVHFFSPNRESGKIEKVTPTIDRDGKLTSWPEGFFDQYDAALASLL